MQTTATENTVLTDRTARIRLAAAATVDERTILRLYRAAGHVRSASRTRIVEAAQRLGLPLPL